MIRLAAVITIGIMAALWLGLWALQIAVFAAGVIATALALLIGLVIVGCAKVRRGPPAAIPASAPPLTGWQKVQMINAAQAQAREKAERAASARAAKARLHKHKRHRGGHAFHHVRHHLHR